MSIRILFGSLISQYTENLPITLLGCLVVLALLLIPSQDDTTRQETLLIHPGEGDLKRQCQGRTV